MSLIVHTARISYGGPDRFDVTRKTAWLAQKAKKPALGDPFAPSWFLLKGGKSGAMAWDHYAADFLDEMRLSYLVHRAAWDELLARPHVVLVCFCVNHLRCHRKLLAEILVKCGAKYEGETVWPVAA